MSSLLLDWIENELISAGFNEDGSFFLSLFVFEDLSFFVFLLDFFDLLFFVFAFFSVCSIFFLLLFFKTLPRLSFTKLLFEEEWEDEVGEQTELRGDEDLKDDEEEGDEGDDDTEETSEEDRRDKKDPFRFEDEVEDDKEFSSDVMLPPSMSDW